MLAAIILTTLVAGTPDLSFVWPRINTVGHAPVELWIQLRTPRHPDNRAITVSWDGDDPRSEAGSFILQLEGNLSAVVNPREPRRLRLGGCGNYVIVAQLWRIVGNKLKVTAQATRQVRVIGLGCGQLPKELRGETAPKRSSGIPHTATPDRSRGQLPLRSRARRSDPRSYDGSRLERVK